MKMSMFTVYTRSYPPCPYCIKLKELMRIYGYDFYELDITDPQIKKDFLEAGFKTVPQVHLFTGNGQKHIGGYETTKDYLRDNFFKYHPNKDKVIQELRELDD
jgi:glutaredoxin